MRKQSEAIKPQRNNQVKVSVSTYVMTVLSFVILLFLTDKFDLVSPHSSYVLMFWTFYYYSIKKMQKSDPETSQHQTFIILGKFKC